jgi:hypothetical protein
MESAGAMASLASNIRSVKDKTALIALVALIAPAANKKCAYSIIPHRTAG